MEENRMYRDGVQAMCAVAWIKGNHDGHTPARQQLEATFLLIEQMARIADLLEKADKNLCFDIKGA